MKMKSVIVAFLLSSACATVNNGKNRSVDQSIIVNMVCGNREAEARQYILARGFTQPDVTERIEWARKDCTK